MLLSKLPTLDELIDPSWHYRLKSREIVFSFDTSRLDEVFAARQVTLDHRMELRIKVGGDDVDGLELLGFTSVKSIDDVVTLLSCVASVKKELKLRSVESKIQMLISYAREIFNRKPETETTDSQLTFISEQIRIIMNRWEKRDGRFYKYSSSFLKVFIRFGIV